MKQKTFSLKGIIIYMLLSYSRVWIVTLSIILQQDNCKGFEKKKKKICMLKEAFQWKTKSLNI